MRHCRLNVDITRASCLAALSVTISSLTTHAVEESVLIRDFENIGEYRRNEDGGDPAQLTLDADAPREGKYGLRIAYVKGPKGWMNVTTPALLEPYVEAVTLQVRKQSADPDTAMHLWLMEKGGDAWISKTVRLGDLPAGWTTVRVPLSDFSYFRGAGKQKGLDHRAVDRLMIGFNYGGCVVTVDDLRYTGENLKTAWEKAMKLRKSVAIDAKEIRVANFLGFGGEWDPKFFTMGTFQNVATDFTNAVTVTEEDWQLELKRLRWMRPPIMRVMMCQGWCYPGGTWSTNTAHMRSLYRHLDFCQEQGIQVILTEWGINSKGWLDVPGFDRLDDPRYGDAVATYIDHLVREKGYTCIKYFVLVNEPNCSYRDGNEEWRKGVSAVSKAIDAKGLGGQISFMGSDSTMGEEFHRKAVDTLAGTIDAWDVHCYAEIRKIDAGELESWYRGMWDYVDAHDPNGKSKPRVVAEIGVVSQGFSAGNNPLHQDFLYGLLISDHAVQAVCAGSSAALAWMFSDSSHAGFTWGMWGNKKTNFALKPWFYPWSLLCRYFPRGSRVLATVHDTTGLRTLAAVTKDGKGLTVVLVNREGERAVTLRGEGLGKRPVVRYVYARDSAKADADGFPLPVGQDIIDLESGHEIRLPAESVVVLTTPGPSPGESTGK